MFPACVLVAKPAGKCPDKRGGALGTLRGGRCGIPSHALALNYGAVLVLADVQPVRPAQSLLWHAIACVGTL